jgi:aryl-alcohol dehydrogenase-like predicted oxidoreductase
MDYRPLGRTGLKVSELCLGSMQFGWTASEETSFQILSTALEAGVNFIDTADVYSRWIPGNAGGVSETIIGSWLRTHNISRHQLVIATKVFAAMGDGPNDKGLSRSHIMHAVECSLLRLGTDYIDLYQAHRMDTETPLDETLRAFDDLVHQGKVRYIGCSNTPAWRLVEALWTSDHLGLVRYECLQPRYSLVLRAEYERELAMVCAKFGVGVIPYSPLAGGFLTGKYRQDTALPESERADYVRRRIMNHRNFAVLDKITELGRLRDKTVSQMALAWLLSQPTVTAPIIGPRSVEQLKDNLGAAGVRLTTPEMDALQTLSQWE